MKGNCIDKFVENKLNKSILKTLQLRFLIRSRVNNRNTNSDYFNSLCYEEDFTDIRKIKEEANHLVDECNKFLERISEQYSKLS